MRLARVGADGAWFMAPDRVTDSVASKLRAELREFRDRYGPPVRMLDFIRQTNPANRSCSTGERIQLVELETLVNQSTTLMAHLQALVELIKGGNSRFTVRENLRKLMEHLCNDGYMHLADKGTDTYQVTGKIEQLYSVLTFLDENKAIDDFEADDQLELTVDGAAVSDGQEHER
jgi:hypothetical protein